MIVVMAVSASTTEIQQVVSTIENQGMRALIMPGGERVAIGIPSAIPPETRELLAQNLGGLHGVEHVAHVSRPYKLASREFHRADTVIAIQEVR